MVIIIEKIVGFFFFFFKPLKVSGPMLQQRLLVFFERPIQRESADVQSLDSLVLTIEWAFSVSHDKHNTRLIMHC